MNSRPTIHRGLTGESVLSKQAEEQLTEGLMDEIGGESFPASDPPAWGVVAARMKTARSRAVQRSEGNDA